MVIRKKKELRLKIRQQTAKMTIAEKREQALRVFGAVENTEQFRTAGTVGFFWSLWDELPTHDIVEKWSVNKRIVLPSVAGDRMEFVEFRKGCRMEESSLKVMCPSDGDVVNPDEIDLLIVPGVAFSREGMRLGRGKGYYDRFMSDLRAYKIGVCMSHQVSAEIPCEAHDLKVDMVVSPD